MLDIGESFLECLDKEQERKKLLETETKIQNNTEMCIRDRIYKQWLMILANFQQIYTLIFPHQKMKKRNFYTSI